MQKVLDDKDISNGDSSRPSCGRQQHVEWCSIKAYLPAKTLEIVSFTVASEKAESLTEVASFDAVFFWQLCFLFVEVGT